MYPSWLLFSDTPVKLHMKGRPQNSRSWPCIWSFWNWKKLRSHPSWTFTFVFAFWIFIVFLVPLRPLNQVISMNYLVLPKPFITQFIINVVRPWKSLLMILLRKAHRRQTNSLGTGKYAINWLQIFCRPCCFWMGLSPTVCFLYLFNHVTSCWHCRVGIVNKQNNAADIPIFCCPLWTPLAVDTTCSIGQ